MRFVQVLVLKGTVINLTWVRYLWNRRESRGKLSQVSPECVFNRSSCLKSSWVSFWYVHHVHSFSLSWNKPLPHRSGICRWCTRYGLSPSCPPNDSLNSLTRNTSSQRTTTNPTPRRSDLHRLPWGLVVTPRNLVQPQVAQLLLCAPPR